MRTIFTLCLLLYSLFSSTQNLNWVSANLGADRMEISQILRNDGGIYVVGSFSGEVDFDPGPQTLLYNSAGNYDMFIQKLSHNGELIWVVTIGGEGYDHINSIIELNNHIYLSGVFSSTVDFDPGPDEAKMKAGSGFTGFILNIDNSGDFNWVKNIGDGQFNVHISKDSQGNIYGTGLLMAASDLDPGVDTALFAPMVYHDTYIAKYDSLLNFQWARQLQANHWVFPTDIVVLNDSVIVISGRFNDSTILDFDSSRMTRCYGKIDGFVMAVSESGAFKWYHHIAEGSGSGEAEPWDLDVAGEHILVAGSFNGFVNFLANHGYYPLDSEERDAFFMKLKDGKNGNFVFAKKLGGQGDDMAYSISANKDASVYYVAGEFQGSANLTPIGYPAGSNPPKTIVNSNGLKDAFVIKTQDNGNHIGNFTLGGSGQDVASIVYGFEQDQLLLGGGFSDTVNFGIGIQSAVLISGNNASTFIAEYNFNPTGLDRFEIEKSPFRIYPNPSSGLFYIEFNDAEMNGDISIFDWMGRRVTALSFSSREIEELTIDGPSGLYHLHIRTNDAYWVERVVKE